MQRTLEHCGMITKLGERPMQEDDKCYGFQRDQTDDEPCDECAKCKLNAFYEE